MFSDLSLTRRSLMSALGAGGASWFLPSMKQAGAAVTGAGTPPKRLVVVFSAQGSQRNRWMMRKPGLDETTDWDFPLASMDQASFSEILRPLYAHRSKMLVIDGLPMMTALTDTRGLNDHFRGWMGSLTGSHISAEGTNLAGGPSFDQVVANAISRPGQTKSLELAVRGYLPAIWAAKGVGITPQLSASSAMSRLMFPKAPASTAAPLTDADRVRSAQAAVFSLTSGMFDSASKRLSGEDRRKLELHRDMMRDLAANVASAQTNTCVAPKLPPAASSDYMALSRQMNTLITAGLACDMTRVISLQLTDVGNDLVGNVPGSLHNEYFHDCNMNVVHPNSTDVMSKNCQIHAQVIADLLDGLDKVPEGNGTMLDNTLVAWFYEMESGAHGFGNMAHVLFGNVGGHFKTGRYVRYAPKHEFAPRGQSRRVGPPHNKLIVSILKAYGLQQNQIGESKVMLAGNPTPIDLTGPLDRLT
jgi:hypothetical protein